MYGAGNVIFYVLKWKKSLLPQLYNTFFFFFFLKWGYDIFLSTLQESTDPMRRMKSVCQQ